ncbi:MAG: CRISPR-associated endonuclease Cas3'', partial [Bacilli bacterium]|nr:CRISPR-associated endonuclease Cas3'' [Bacilli bacterium]
MKSVDQILAQAPDVKMILSHQETYLAHTHHTKAPELLYEHVNLVNAYTGNLVKEHRLDTIIDNLIDAYVKNWGKDEMKDFIKTLFVHSIVFHDFGKINDNFQIKRMKNKLFSSKTYESLNPDYGHSYLSAFVFLSYHISLILEMDLNQEDQSKLIGHCFFFAYPILQHHSPALFDVIEKDGLFSRFKDVLNELKPFLKKYFIDFNEQMLKAIFSNVEELWFKMISDKIISESFPLYALLKINYSLLTASDYLATHEYMNGGQNSQIMDFGVLNNRERNKEIYKHLTGFKYNANIYEELATHKLSFPNTRSKENLNFLRKQMAIEVINQIKLNSKKNLFYLEAPTGGGKTNFSALVIGELLMTNPELNKVFYVFPFTTLITQTYGVLKESFGLTDDEVVELHSKAPFSSSSERSKDGVYGSDKKDFIDNLFALYPFTLLSHVKFFDILKTNGKEKNYLLHRLANSIVVIDEIQSYNPSIWDK